MPKGRWGVKSSPPPRLISCTLLSTQQSIINQRNSSSIWLTLNSSLPHDLGTFSWPFVTFLILHRARGWNQGNLAGVMHLSWHLSWALLSAALSAFERMCPRQQSMGNVQHGSTAEGVAWANTRLNTSEPRLCFVRSQDPSDICIWSARSVEELWKRQLLAYWSVSVANIPYICPLSYNWPLM